MVKKKYHREVIKAMVDHDELFLDYVWSLFNNLEDTDDPNVVESVLYMVKCYDFNVDVLPEKLYNAVAEELKKDAIESYAEDREEDGFYL